MLRDPGLIPLSRDHHHALALYVFTNRALSIDDSAACVEQQAKRIVEKFDSEIRGHFDFEEQVLFPALVDFPTLRQLVDDLLTEHRKLISLIELLRSNGGRQVVDEFCSTLERHVRTEERVLFEEAQRHLTWEQLDAIGKARVKE